jgi:hypothetical protein
MSGSLSKGEKLVRNYDPEWKTLTGITNWLSRKIPKKSAKIYMVVLVISAADYSITENLEILAQILKLLKETYSKFDL